MRPLGGISPGWVSPYGHPEVTLPPWLSPIRGGLARGQLPGGFPPTPAMDFHARAPIAPVGRIPAGGTPKAGMTPLHPANTVHPGFLHSAPTRGVRDKGEPPGVLSSPRGLRPDHPLFWERGRPAPKLRLRSDGKRCRCSPHLGSLPLSASLVGFSPPVPKVNVHAIIFIYSQDAARMFLLIVFCQSDSFLLLKQAAWKNIPIWGEG